MIQDEEALGYQHGYMLNNPEYRQALERLVEIEKLFNVFYENWRKTNFP